MTYFGKIESYDANNGTGMILPETGSEALPFRMADLEQHAREPMANERYGYDTSEVNGSHKRAINLRRDRADLQKEQARSQPG